MPPQTPRCEFLAQRTSFVLLCLVLLHCQSVISAQGFAVKSIAQSYPFSGGPNILTVYLESDTRLTAAQDSVVTISGLTGAVASDPVTLGEAAGDDGHLVFSDGTTQGKGTWISDGTLKLTVYARETTPWMESGTTYSFSFEVTNPSSSQVSPTVYVAASGSVAIAATQMTKPGTDNFGVTNGTNPLTVVVPTFSTKSIEQSNPFADQDNTLTVTLQSDTHSAPAGTIVTITGLAGSDTATTSTLGLSSGPDSALGSTGDWNHDGTLTLTVAAGKELAKGQAYSITFELANPSSAMTSPTVNVAATLKDSAKTVGSVTLSAMDKPGGTLYGVINGNDPLTVMVPCLAGEYKDNSTGQVRCLHCPYASWSPINSEQVKYAKVAWKSVRTSVNPYARD